MYNRGRVGIRTVSCGTQPLTDLEEHKLSATSGIARPQRILEMKIQRERNRIGEMVVSKLNLYARYF